MAKDRLGGKRLSVAREIARDGGNLGLRLFRNRTGLEVTVKGVQDLVSNADRQIEALLRSRLAAEFPDDAFLGEESGRESGADSTAGIWVVDPIDGTDNFVRGMNGWCVSVAFVVGDVVEIGVVFDPVSGEEFVAHRGHGATLNGDPLAPPTVSSFAEGLFGLGYSLRRPPEPTIRVLSGLLAEKGMFQRTGSGALMLANVACGRYIGFYEAHINAWDCLAGIALVRESGGWTSDFLSGNGLFEGNPLAAGAPGMADAMRRITGLS